MKTEVWKDAPEYEGIYQVSSFGNIRSVDRVVTFNGRWGQVDQPLKGKPRKPQAHNNGYLQITMSRSGKIRNFLVHRIVYSAFVGAPEDDEEINHINGNKHDNRLSNLEAVTRSQNILHSFNNLGRSTNPRRGTEAENAMLTDGIVRKMRSLYESGVRQVDIAKKFGVSKNRVWSVVHRKSWTHVE